MNPSPSPSGRHLWLSIAAGVILLAILALAPMVFTGMGAGGSIHEWTGTGELPANGNTDFSPFTPVFPAPSDKLKETASPAFTAQLFSEAERYRPLIHTAGTQVHMGFWSGRGNHGSLVTLLDAINDLPGSASPYPQVAIWDEGATSSNQYPSYVAMLNENWYERAAAVNGTVTLLGRKYTDPHPVTFQQADDIWGQYSQRYADMAEPIAQSTGKPVKVWCFVEGARANRIFYTYELPELRALEQKGVVRVYFATKKTANWTTASDWIEGTANAPAPVPAP
jgi:hypothetical protein